MELSNLLVLKIMNVWFSLLDEFQAKYLFQLDSFVFHWALELLYTCLHEVCESLIWQWALKGCFYYLYKHTGTAFLLIYAEYVI